MKKLYILFIVVTIFSYLNKTAYAASVFINEIHYDNSGVDQNEGIEIAGPAGIDLSGWSIVLYNGSSGSAYKNVALNSTISDQQNGYGTLFFSISPLQNGTPDAIALVDSSNNVAQFLSYEGSFSATDGAAIGLTSTDIGVSETSSTLLGYSLQLTGTGNQDGDFIWASPQSHSYNLINSGQVFTVAIPEPSTIFLVGGCLFFLIIFSNRDKEKIITHFVFRDYIPKPIQTNRSQTGGAALSN